MPSGDADETQRVSTYVPADQKAEWDRHADELGMSQSEFVRTMVQAGRRRFTLDPDEAPERDATPGGRGLEDTVLDALRTEEALDWDELVAELTESVEADLETALDALQSEDAVRYSGRQGGYTLTEGTDE